MINCRSRKVCHGDRLVNHSSQFAVMKPAEAEVSLWKSELMIGDSLLDYEHQIVFALIENCIRLSRIGGARTQQLDLLRVLESYLAYHFGSEEKMMLADADEGFEQHRSQHTHALGKLSVDISDIEKNHRSLTVQQVAYGLYDWYLQHLKEDKKLIH